MRKWANGKSVIEKPVWKRAEAAGQAEEKANVYLLAYSNEKKNEEGRKLIMENEKKAK